MITSRTIAAAGPADTELVAASRAGSREAFRTIVERYQVLVCSLALSATGNVSQSEDVAQETFLSAWQELGALREPAKLRAWLCGIARHRIQRSHRRDSHEPASHAAPLDAADDIPTVEAPPSEQAVTRDEETILWRSLGRIPETYREPLILYYRQHKSISTVAAELELSEDTVRQRMSRGRKLLEAEVHAFLESALERSAPGEAFTTGVLGALPLAAGSALAAGAGAKGAAVAKSGLLLAGLGPASGLLVGFASQWLVIRAATPVRDRRAKLTRLVITWACLLALPIAGEESVQWLVRALGWGDRRWFAAVALFWGLYAAALATWLIVLYRRELLAQQTRDETVGNSGGGARPLSLVQTAAMVGGVYLTIMSWLLFLTWRLHDRTTFVSVLAALPVLSVGSFYRLRSRAGVGTVKAAWGFATWCCLVVVGAVNLRLDAWVAAARGISVAAVRQQLPLGMIPWLTAALAAWCGLALALTRPKSRRGPVSR